MWVWAGAVFIVRVRVSEYIVCFRVFVFECISLYIER